MKRLWAVFAALLVGVFAFAEEASPNAPVSQYTGFSAGATVLHQYALGDYADYVLCNIGGGLVLEYALPLPNMQSWGCSVHTEFGYTVPKSDSIFSSDSDIRATVGAWWRYPFALGNYWFAFQPELTAGLVIWNSKYDSDNSSVSDKTNVNFLLGIAPAVRWLATPVLDVELAPLFTFAPEKDANTLMLGIRLGAVFHVQEFAARKAERKGAQSAVTVYDESAANAEASVGQ